MNILLRLARQREKSKQIERRLVGSIAVAARRIGLIVTTAPGPRATGSIVKRGKERWAVVIDLSSSRDRKTKKLKRRQKWITVRGTRKQAEARLQSILRQRNAGGRLEG